MELQGELAYPLQREESFLLRWLSLRQQCQLLAMQHRLQLLLHLE
jgi:hypothetical protein